MAPGASTVWTVNVTPLANGTAGGLTYTVNATATSQGDATKTDQVRTQTTCTAPNLVMSKSVDLANALPGQDIHYSLVASSTGLSNANAIVLVDSIPSYADSASEARASPQEPADSPRRWRTRATTASPGHTRRARAGARRRRVTITASRTYAGR
jgi:uncharacterized repeat protein (TIGR01451 family)